MENTLDKKSSILVLKSKFFLIRIVSYFFFLLFPVWIQKTLNMSDASMSLTMLLYILFMVGQWFLLGKEIDHRLKIYFRVNSSMDRVVYRLFLGLFFTIFYFNFLNLFPSKWIYNIFWTTWVILGLFYSWPTRGKIIQESVSSNFGEFKYLDSFEKTVVLMSLVLFMFSIPEMPSLDSFSDLRMYFDPTSSISNIYWNFVKVNYYPFKSYPSLLKIAISMHFYLIGAGVFLVNLYALLRFFVSRRLSLLGVLAIVSSWSFSKILVGSFGDTLVSTFSLLWLWSTLWAFRSSTYRSGLFLGLISFYGVLLNNSYFFLSIIQISIFFFYFLKEKTFWYKKQIMRYSLFGFLVSLMIFFNEFNLSSYFNFNFDRIIFDYKSILGRKAFFTLSVIGIIIFFWKLVKSKFQKQLDLIRIDSKLINSLLIFVILLILHGYVFNSRLAHSFTIMWILTIFSLFPIEMLFQKISRLRSKRNMIYLVYILICILDSHFEGRVKIFLRLF